MIVYAVLGELDGDYMSKFSGNFVANQKHLIMIKNEKLKFWS